MTVTPQDRAKLDRAIGAARQIIESDLRRRAEGDYGLVAPSEVQPENALALSPAALAARRQLVDVVEHLRRADGDEAGPVGRLLREASFTLLNRLVAVRVAEASGLLAPALADGPRSRGFLDLLELFPLLRDEPRAGTGRSCASVLMSWLATLRCCSILATRCWRLSPLHALSPRLSTSCPTPAQRDLVGARRVRMDLPVLQSARRTSRDARGLRAPSSSRELAVRNQFFTPRYVVDFLVQNTLGRRLMDGGFGQELAERLKLLVPDGGDDDRHLSWRTFAYLTRRWIGSLLARLLRRARSRVGVCGDHDEAAPLIVPALWGIDIDPRCGQVAAAAMALHARRRCRDGDVPRPNIFTARALPDDPDAWREALADLDDRERTLVRRMQRYSARRRSSERC